MTQKRQSDLRLRWRRMRLRQRQDAGVTSNSPSSSTSSLFARLSPSAVASLQRDALCRAEMEEGDLKISTDGWSISSSTGGNRSSRVVFLPLSVKFGPHKTIYVSYNGGEANDDDGQGACIVCCCCTVYPLSRQ